MMFTKPSVEHFIVLFTVASKSLLSYGETAATNVGNLRGDIKEEQEDKIVKDDIILDQVLEGILPVSSLTKDVGMWLGLNMASATTKSNGVENEEVKRGSSDPLKCYNITIVTDSDCSWSGTDSNIYLTLYGTEQNLDGTFKESRDKKLNHLLDGNAFESGDTDTLKLCGMPNIGEITKIGVRGGGDTWDPITITVDTKQFKFPEKCPEVGENEVQAFPPVLLSDPLKCYNITIVTDSDCLWSGTDSNIYLTLYGTEQNLDGTFKEIRDKKLNNLIDGDAFESGDTDTLNLCNMPNIGEITHIGVRGGSDEWDPSKIVVDGREFRFKKTCPGVGEDEVQAFP